MLDIKQFIIFIKEKFKENINNVFYFEIDEDYKETYPVLVYDLDYKITNQNRINGRITANLYDNRFNNVLEIEQLAQDIYNSFNYYRTYANKNDVNFSVMIVNVRVQNAPTEEKNLKRKLITIDFEVQFEEN